MPYPIIFMDECGYTGNDLLNKEQPVFALATLNCSDAQAQKLKKQFFREVKAKELKHSSLSKHSKQQTMIIDFIRHLTKDQKLLKMTVVHKRYAVVTKMVDIVVEELAHADGIDFYNKGQNIAYSNLLYYLIPHYAGESFFNEMLTSFQELMRTRTAESYDRFFSLFFKRKFPEDLAKVLSPFQAFHLRIGREILSYPNIIFEVTLGSASVLMVQWRKSLNKNMILVHDISSPMAKNKEIWDSLVDPNILPDTVGYDRRKITFPIGVRKTIFEDSMNRVGLQLVDILAGAFTRWGKFLISGRKNSNSYEQKLDKLLLGNFEGTFIWPSNAITPKELDTNGEDSGNLIDHIARIIRKRP